MSAARIFLKHLAKIALEAVPGGGLVEKVGEMVHELWSHWAKGRSVAERRAAIAELAAMPPGQNARLAHDIVLEEAPNLPPDQQLQLESFVAAVAPKVQQSLRRPDDPKGATVPDQLRINGPEDLVKFVPTRFAQLKPGPAPKGTGDWVLDRPLGAGGFGEVWLAHQLYDPKIVAALKYCTDKEARHRLMTHEAAICARVKARGDHPGIVKLQHTYLNADLPCLEYEYVDGGELGAWLEERVSSGRPPKPPEVASIVQRLAEATAFMHEALPEPVVHRDLKPANVLVARDGPGSYQIKIADFGIGGIVADRAVAEHARGGASRYGAGLTRSVEGSFSLLYASPEQVRGGQSDPRDDVHALGMIWYQLLMGDLALERPGGLEWVDELKAKGLTEAQVKVLGKCLEPAGRRYPNARALVNALMPTISVAPSPSPPPPREQNVVVTTTNVPMDAVPVPVLAPPPPPPPPPPPRPVVAPPVAVPARSRVVAPTTTGQGPRVWPRLVGLVLIVGVVIGVAWVFNRQPNDTRGKVDVSKGPAKPDEAKIQIEIAKPGEVKSQPAKPDEVKIDSLGLVMVRVPKGSFMMGSDDQSAAEKPCHKVNITKDFYLAQTEFTVGMNKLLKGEKPAKGDDVPLVAVSWLDVVAICNQLSAREKLAPYYQVNGADVKILGGLGYRLPTEAEWEYACRAGSQALFAFGDDASKLDQHAWYYANSNGKIHPVGQKLKNAFGLFDMHGNAWEWCEDWFVEKYDSLEIRKSIAENDPGGPNSGGLRVLRGGAFYNSTDYCRCAFRNWYDPGGGILYFGFRPARTFP